jgi:hypothetical protein
MSGLAPSLHFAPLAWALLLAAACRLTPPARQRAWPALLVGIAALLPLAGEGSLASWLAGLFGAPSLTLLQLAGLRLAGRPLPPLPGRRSALALATGALLFYAFALGWSGVDPYAWGYRPYALLLALAGVAGWLARRGAANWLWLLAIDLGVWSVGLPTSDNLWDALVDPFLFLVILAAAWRRPTRN